MTKPIHTDRVIALLNRLASDNEHERAAAGFLLAEMAKGAQKTVAEYVRSQVAFTAFTLSEPTNIRSPTTRLSREESSETLRSLMHAIRDYSIEHLTEWEQQFIDSVLDRWPTIITSRQKETIDRIIQKL